EGANRHKPQMLTPEEFHYGFTNTLTLEESKPIYDRLAVPGPGRVLFQAAFANFTPHAVTTVSRHNSSRAPLLFLANGKDHTVPAAVTRAAYKIPKQTGPPPPPKRSRSRRAPSPSPGSPPPAPTPPSPRTAGKRGRTPRSTGPCATRGPTPPKML